MTVQVASIIFFNNNKILLGLRQHVEISNHHWGLPGGRIEKNESAYNAALREALEEVELTPASLSTPFQALDSRGVKHHIFLCKQWQGTAVNSEPYLCKELRWFKSTEIPTNTINIIHQALKHFQLL